MLLTLHRQENVDDKIVFGNILNGLSRVSTRMNLPVVFPVHPRTVKMLDKFGLTLPSGVRTIQPLGFFDFLRLEANAALALTDSGGVQEETCILKVPCVTIRENTERPETVMVGSNLICGTEPQAILRAAEKMIKVKRNWKNPFGDGRASQRILNILLS